MHIRSLPRHGVSGSLAGALAIAVIAAPAAGAQPWHTLGPGTGATPRAYIHPVVTRTIDDGFDLASAAIGGGVSAALLLAAGGASASHRRHGLRVGRRPQH